MQIYHESTFSIQESFKLILFIDYYVTTSLSFLFIWKINIGYHFIIHNKTCSNEKAIKNWIFDKDKICEIIYFFCFWKEWNMDSWNNHINILFVFISDCVCVEKLLRHVTGRIFLFHKIYMFYEATFFHWSTYFWSNYLTTFAKSVFLNTSMIYVIARIYIGENIFSLNYPTTFYCVCTI